MKYDVEIILVFEYFVFVFEGVFFVAGLPGLLKIKVRLIIDGVMSAVQIVHYILDNPHLFEVVQLRYPSLDNCGQLISQSLSVASCDVLLGGIKRLSLSDFDQARYPVSFLETTHRIK